MPREEVSPELSATPGRFLSTTTRAGEASGVSGAKWPEVADLLVFLSFLLLRLSLLRWDLAGNLSLKSGFPFASWVFTSPRAFRRVLEPVFGLGDPRTEPRLDFVGGIRGTDALMDAVTSGRAVAAVSMYPTTIDQLMQVADAGAVMPPKSTWFEPKLRGGVVLHRLV